MICPNCGQKTQGTSCQWCHYPSVEDRTVKTRVAERANRNSGLKIFGRFISATLALAIAGFIFSHFSPDYNIYLVRSESMAPAVKMGEMIITGPVNGPINGEVSPGTIVTYKHSKGLVTHRVLSIDSNKLVTKGDALEEPDPWSVTLSDLESVYLFKIPYVGYVSNYIRSKLGWFLVIILPATLLVALLVKDLVKEALSSS